MFFLAVFPRKERCLLYAVCAPLCAARYAAQRRISIVVTCIALDEVSAFLRLQTQRIRMLCYFHLTSPTPNYLHNVTACLDQECTELERDDFDTTAEFQVLERNMSVERLRNVSERSPSCLLLVDSPITLCSVSTASC